VGTEFNLFWSHNITGQGQIVGHGDSGIDADMCFLYVWYVESAV
jgi:hypothetical protein